MALTPARSRENKRAERYAILNLKVTEYQKRAFGLLYI